MNTVYLNGEFLEREKVAVSITDFGFNYGAGVYEVVLVLEGKTFQFAEHLTRLGRSAAKIGLEFDTETLSAVPEKLLTANPLKFGMLYIQLSFGDYGVRSHEIPKSQRPTVLAFLQEMKPYPAECFTAGVKLKSLPDDRWDHCDIKATALLANVLSQNAVMREGFYEGLYFDPKTEEVAECTTANIFCVIDDVLITPPDSTRVLPGITRDTIPSLAQTLGIKSERWSITLPELQRASELFISSTTREIMPVCALDSTRYKAPGRITKQLMHALANEDRKSVV